MTSTDDMAAFVTDTTYDDLSETVVDELKKRMLDSIGIGIGALGDAPVDIVHKTVTEVSTDGACTLWGTGEEVSLPQAAMMNTTLTRYLDYMDSFLAPGETPHPSDNIAAAIVCGEYSDRSGTDLITAVGIAYEIQAALAWNAPVRDRGWDHVTHTIFSATAASATMLDLDHEQTMNALGIAGTAHNALRVTRTGEIGTWKGIASANTARNAVYSTMLAKNGMDGPQDVFNGEKGWKHIVAGDFDCAFDPGCTAVKKTMTKKYVAETYAQSAVEGLLELVDDHDIDSDSITSIHLDTFQGAKQIIGGGEGGDRHHVETKEQADHSLPYMLAVAVLDGELLNRQYAPDRIQQDDVQDLLQTVTVEAQDELTERFEDGEMPANLTVKTADSETYTIEKAAFDGHPTSPASWEMIENKFRTMTDDRFNDEQQSTVIDMVRNLEQYEVAELVRVLAW
jgi:2-methylcitrate dehydratase